MKRRQGTVKYVTKTVASNKAAFSDSNLYKDALRCCVFPLLSSTGIQKKKPPTPSTSSIEHYYEKISGLATDITTINKTSVVLADKAVVLFKDRLLQMANVMANIPKEKEKFFSIAGLQLLKTVGNQNHIVSDLKDLLVLIATCVSNAMKNYDRATKKTRSDEESDELLKSVVELYMGIIRGAISSSPTQGSIKFHESDLLNKKEVWSGLLQPFFKSTKAQDAAADTNNESSQFLALWLRIVFDVPKDYHDTAVLDAKKNGNEKYVFAEIQNYIDDLKNDRVKFSSLKDFSSVEAYNSWKSSELHMLSGLQKVMDLRFGNNVAHKSINTLDLIPKSSHLYYTKLLAKCLDHDLSNQKKEIGLSKNSQQVLTECALRWRLGKVFREIALLDILIQRFHAKVLLLEDVYPQLTNVLKLCFDVTTLKKSDTVYYLTTLKGLKKSVRVYFASFSEDFKVLTPESAVFSDGTMQLAIKVSRDIVNSPVWQTQPDYQTIKQLNSDIYDLLMESINSRYHHLNNRLSSQPREILRLTLLAKAINIEINKYAMYYPTKVLEEEDGSGGYHLSLVTAETCFKYLILELNNMEYTINSTSKDDEYAIKETLDLYQAVKLLHNICNENQMLISRNFNVEQWFYPYIIKYLDMADQKISEWVKPAVDVEQYEPILPPSNMYSSSVLDMFTTFHHALDFIENFNWKELGKKEKLIQKFMRTLSKALKEYTQLMFSEFKLILEENSFEEYSFTKQSCMKLNNLLGAKSKLTEVLEKLGVNSKGEQKFDPNAKKSEPNPVSSTFNVTVIRATDLLACDWTTSDPYTVLSYEGTELNRTKVIDKNLNPVWNETFPIYLPKDLNDNKSFLDLIVFDKDLLTADDICGSAQIFLRDRLYDDFLSHDVDIDLKPQGKLYIRICKEGEWEDSTWWVKKAEEWIKQTIDDMVKVYVDQMNRYFKASLNKLFPSESKISGFFASITSTFTSASVLTGEEDADISKEEKLENALLPLFNYSDKQFSLFMENIDPALGDYLIEINPWLKQKEFLFLNKNVNNDRVEKKEQSIEVNYPTLSKRNLQLESSFEEPHIIIKLVWQEYLKTFKVFLLSFNSYNEEKQKTNNGNKIFITKENKVKVGIIRLVVEMIKTLFYCDLDGFSIPELENLHYREVLELITIYSK
ncbi:hypothetical protein HDU92_007581 [Lobulomyces angularis]|nr:hypothetical protein HDU92_007581 [Lobulomyces angularis]